MCVCVCVCVCVCGWLGLCVKLCVGVCLGLCVKNVKDIRGGVGMNGICGGVECG